MKNVVISQVVPGSPADRAGLRSGDKLCKINDQSPRDVIDYQIISDDGEVGIEVTRGGRRLNFLIEKQVHENLGLRFDASIFDRLKSCRNRCVFCFIDQNPPDLRSSLYLKDDDYRLSFLYGNFITLTNMDEDEVKRIIAQKLSPLYISLHATSPVVRRKMLAPKDEDRALSILDRFLRAGIAVHVQIVLCPGLNDGEELEVTLVDLDRFYSEISSIGIVPVGITAYQKNDSLRPFTQTETRLLIERTDQKRKMFKEKKGTGWIFLADEFYLKAGQELPGSDYYEDFPQLENGIGLARLFTDGLGEKLRNINRFDRATGTFVFLSGELFAPLLEKAALDITKKSRVECEVVAVPNRFFGGCVSVAGLLTGFDIIAYFQASTKPRDSKIYLIPDNMLNQDGQFLDGSTVEDLKKTLQLTFQVVPSQGAEFVAWFSGGGK